MAARSFTFFFCVLSDISLSSEDLFQKLIALKNPLRVGFSSSGIATETESALLLLPKSRVEKSGLPSAGLPICRIAVF